MKLRASEVLFLQSTNKTMNTKEQDLLLDIKHGSLDTISGIFSLDDIKSIAFRDDDNGGAVMSLTGYMRHADGELSIFVSRRTDDDPKPSESATI